MDELNLKKDLISINYTAGKVITPRWIVIHETANTARGADARAHRKYFGTNKTARASAHFVVDDGCVIQLGEFEPGKCWQMWHVGSGKFKHPIYNSNAIGIEICVNADGDYEAARARAIRLTRYVMERTGIPPEQVVRHYDAWGKHCPARMLETPSLWDNFKAEIAKKTMKPVENDTKNCRHFAQTFKNGVFL